MVCEPLTTADERMIATFFVDDDAQVLGDAEIEKFRTTFPLQPARTVADVAVDEMSVPFWMLKLEPPPVGGGLKVTVNVPPAATELGAVIVGDRKSTRPNSSTI